MTNLFPASKNVHAYVMDDIVMSCYVFLLLKTWPSGKLQFFRKKCQVFVNFLTVKWQFSGGSGLQRAVAIFVIVELWTHSCVEVKVKYWNVTTITLCIFLFSFITNRHRETRYVWVHRINWKWKHIPHTEFCCYVEQGCSIWALSEMLPSKGAKLQKLFQKLLSQ